MARTFEIRFTDTGESGLQKLESQMLDSYLFSCVAAMARVIYDEVVLNVTVENRQGIGRVTGLLGSSIYRAYLPDRSTRELKVYRVSWNKKTAPHGHLLEYGTSRAPAYPFIRPALSHLPNAVSAGVDRLAQRMGGAQ